MSRWLTASIVVLAAGAGAAALFWPTPRRQAVARVKELDGVYSEAPESDGRTFVIVGLSSRPVTEADLVAFRDIRPLHRLILDGTKLPDDALARLEGIEGLQDIRLCGTGVTDAGLAHLARIRTLRSVHVVNTRVSDAGLAHLAGLPNLAFVNAIASRVTAAGAADLQRANPGVRQVLFGIPADD